MILFGLALLLAIVAGGILGWAVMRDTGYLLVAYADTAVETTLWMGLLVLLGAYLLARGVWSLGRRVLESQGQVMRWRSGRKARRARQQTVRGLLLMAEGRWEEAKKTLLGAVQHVETPLINYLNAARAAHELGLPDERDSYLKRAHETTPGAKFAAMLSQAEFRITDGSFEQALAALLDLRKRAPKHKSVLRMLAHCYEALGDWQALHMHLKELADNKAVTEVELRRLSRVVWVSLLRQGSIDGRTDADKAAVAGLWKRLPKSLRGDLDLLQGWIDHLLTLPEPRYAEEAVRLILGHIWAPRFVLIYGTIQTDEIPHQILVAQGWLKERPQDIELMLTLGRLCIATEQYEKAREYLEAALRVEPRKEIYAELGRLCIVLGDEKRGTDFLLLSVGELPAIVQPGQKTG